ncbi:hypothetical protein SYNPCC7002_A1939 [Picosynechococcus sp. PCC 7002]|nr:hypothetical protein SYNPCC7002_A1939 [Picosynechococcus sp. PCC 7002]
MLLSKKEVQKITINPMRIKSWESPRRRGRNDKGKGGAARQRQLKKRNKMLKNKLKGNDHGGEINPLFFMASTTHSDNN